MYWFIAAFFWGIQDSVLDVNNNAVAVTEYGDPADGTAAYTSVQMLSCFVMYLIASELHDADPIYILAIHAVVLACAYVAALFFEFKEPYSSSGQVRTLNLRTVVQSVSFPLPVSLKATSRSVYRLMK